MRFLITLTKWVLESAILFILFNLVVVPIVDTGTKNRWIKLPVLLLLAIPSALLMVWLGYLPYLLFFVLLATTRSSLKVIREPHFEQEAGFCPNMTLFSISHYSYVIATCLLAWVLQIEIGDGRQYVPIWKVLLGKIS